MPKLQLIDISSGNPNLNKSLHLLIKGTTHTIIDYQFPTYNKQINKLACNNRPPIVTNCELLICNISHPSCLIVSRGHIATEYSTKCDNMRTDQTKLSNKVTVCKLKTKEIIIIQYKFGPHLVIRLPEFLLITWHLSTFSISRDLYK